MPPRVAIAVAPLPLTMWSQAVDDSGHGHHKGVPMLDEQRSSHFAILLVGPQLRVRAVSIPVVQPGSAFEDAFRWVPDVETWGDKLRTVLETGEPLTVEHPWGPWSGVGVALPIRDSEGQITGLLGTWTLATPDIRAFEDLIPH